MKKSAFGQGLQKSEREKTDYKFLLYTANPVVWLCSFFFAIFCKKKKRKGRKEKKYINKIKYGISHTLHFPFNTGLSTLLSH